VPNVAGIPQLDLPPGFTCGFLTVPENRAEPDGRKTKIAVAQVPAAAPNPPADPIVYLTGGPGGTAIATAGLMTAKGLNRNRAVIFVDQRGEYHADPLLSCPEVDRSGAEQTALSVQSPAAEAVDLAAVRACRDRLAGRGYDLGAYNTTENASDIADLRAALGIARWNVYGVSYGTDLALQLLRAHPEGIRAVVLDSLVPPRTNLADQFWTSAAEGYRALFDACAAQPACAAAYPGLAEEFTATVNRLATSPLTVPLPASEQGPARTVVIDGYTLANLVVALSLTPGQYPGVPKLIHAAATGNGRPAAEALLSTFSPPGLTAFGLALGVFCSEHVAFTDPATARAAAGTALPGFPDPVLSLVPQSPRLFAECGVWNVPRAPDSVHLPAQSDVPALLMTGTLDAVTPPSQAELAARSLSRSTVVRFPGLGHDTLGSSPCALSIMLDFLDRPGGGYDTACASALPMPTFDTG
jgi:pimeloyl-ACP methyl ester carboxylesterase